MVELDQKYKDAGLTVMGFPSEDFNQELPTNQGVIDFVQKFSVEFPIMDRISVNPPDEPDFWTWLKETSGETKKVRWNFSTKFLVSADGTTVKRYDGVDPNDCEQDILALLPGAGKSGL